MKFFSPSFPDKGEIPRRHTCDGGNLSPELRIEAVQPEAKSLAIVIDDPDAPIGTFTHFLAWNIDPTTQVIREGEASAVGVQGTTSFGTRGYGGPCPPPGMAHRYFFKLYALDAMLDLSQGANIAQLEKQIENHLVGTVQFIGIYGR